MPIARLRVAKRHEVAADAAAEVGDGRGRGRRSRGRGRPGSLGFETGGFVAGDPFVGRLFQAEACEEQSFGVRKLCGRAAAEVDLLEEQVRSSWRKSIAESGNGGMDRRGIFGKFVEEPAGFAAG